MYNNIEFDYKTRIWVGNTKRVSIPMYISRHKHHTFFYEYGYVAPITAYYYKKI